MNRAIRISILVIMIGLVLTVLSVSDAYGLAFRHRKLLDKSYTNLENNEMISGDIDYVVAKLDRGTMTKKIFGIPYKKVDCGYYLIVLTSKENNVAGYVLIEAEDTSKLDELHSATLEVLAGTRAPEDMPSAYTLDAKATEITDDEHAMLDAHFDGTGDPNDPQLLMGENWEASLYVLRETGYTVMIVQLCVGLGIVLIGAVLLIVFNRLKPVEGETVYVNESPDDLVDPSELGAPAEGIIPEQAEATEDEGFTEYTEE